MEANKVDILLQQFNTTLGEWIAFLNDYTLDQLCWKPASDSWSLGQVYMHLTDDTAYFVGQMRTAIASTSNGEKGMHLDAGAMFKAGSFPDTMIEGPATNLPIRQPENKVEILQRLEAIEIEVNRLFAGFNEQKAIGKTGHPGLGYFNALEWLQFAEMHLRHHFRQKKRIDQKLSQ